MSEPYEQVIKLAQKCLAHVPVVVLGSGASLQYGVGGMADLRRHLLATVEPNGACEAAIWTQFTKRLGETENLEQTLQEINLPDPLEEQVVRKTRDMVIRDDVKVLNAVIDGSTRLSLTRLWRYLLHTTHPCVSIVTTNYDRLAEYSADAAEIEHFTGFSKGYIQTFQGTDVPSQAARSTRSAEIWKVHGSVDWFVDGSDNVRLFPDAVTVPKAYRPLLVTPGIGKYQATHTEPFRTIIAQSDVAFADARAILSIGYGFRDVHIQPKLKKRAANERVPTVILARTLTDEAREFITKCDHGQCVGLERAGSGTRAFSCEHQTGVEFPEPIWELNDFLNATI